MNKAEFEHYEREIDAAKVVDSLGSAFLNRFFDDKEKQLFEAFKACPFGDVECINKVHMATKSLNSLQSEIQTVVNTGKLAKKSLEDADL